ncbi:MAG: A/G-specific adenine glycosylase [Shimia sp.]
MGEQLRDHAVAEALLPWYDRHAREMPWRVGPADRAAGQRPDPYRVWLSEVMLQQTTVAAVRDYFLRLTSIWPTVDALAGAEDADVMAAWAGLGYYARARNLLKCARVVSGELGGIFPSTQVELLKLPGIGPYTSAAIAAIAFDEAAAVLDGNVERVLARLHAVETPLPTAKPELMILAERHTPQGRPGDYAQAVMDLGATICTPKNPACGICPLRDPCAGRAAGIHTELPRKLPKTPKPTRHGIAYVVRRTDGAVLLETRPDKGLLGGMLGWPTTDWTDAPTEAPPVEATWIAGPDARHTFTHFHLILATRVAEVGPEATPTRGTFTALKDFSPQSLPTVMRKVFDVTRGLLARDTNPG